MIDAVVDDRAHQVPTRGEHRFIWKLGRVRTCEDRLGQQQVTGQGDDGGGLGRAGLDEFESSFDGERCVPVVPQFHDRRIVQDLDGRDLDRSPLFADVHEDTDGHRGHEPDANAFQYGERIGYLVDGEHAPVAAGFASDDVVTVSRTVMVSPGNSSCSTGLSVTHWPHDRVSVPGSL